MICEELGASISFLNPLHSTPLSFLKSHCFNFKVLPSTGITVHLIEFWPAVTQGADPDASVTLWQNSEPLLGNLIKSAMTKNMQ